MSVAYITEQYLTDIANALRKKTGSTDTITPDKMGEVIETISATGSDTSDATATSDDIAYGKTAYISSGKVTGTSDTVQKMLNRTISSITIPSTVKYIADYALAGCKYLKNLSIPSTVESVGSKAFLGTSLASLSVDSDYDKITGSPWGANINKYDINWLKGTKYPITITQSDNETITVTVDGKSYTDSFEYWKGATLTASAKAASGYKAGDLSATNVTITGPVTFTIGAATVLTAGTKFIINKDNDMGPVNILIDNNVYTIEGYENHANGDYELFDMYGSSYFEMFIKYDSNITSSMFNSDGVFYKFFNSHKLTVTREKDGYGLSWVSPYVVRDYHGSGSAFWRYYSASAASTTSDSVDTIWSNLKTSFQNGENIIVEFTE